jgi:hypothetical protein
MLREVDNSLTPNGCKVEVRIEVCASATSLVVHGLAATADNAVVGPSVL